MAKVRVLALSLWLLVLVSTSSGTGLDKDGDGEVRFVAPFAIVFPLPLAYLFNDGSLTVFLHHPCCRSQLMNSWATNKQR
jgi:hypothetical protein